MEETRKGLTINNRFTLQEYKGSGTFGEVWRASDSQKKKDVAIKIYISLNRQGCDEFLEEYKLELSEIAYIGDDLPDLEIIKTAGLSACPSDAVNEVKQHAKFISSKGGGKGAVRELCDLIYYSKERSQT